MVLNYQVDSFYDEMFAGNGTPRTAYVPVKNELEKMSERDLSFRQQSAEKTLMSMGITFTLYSEDRDERILPFDIIPRIIPAAEWARLERGLTQRLEALNLFLQDIYNERKILKDGVVPREIIESSRDYLPQCEGLTPPKGIWTHIAGTDLIRGDGGEFMVLEDNLRCPSGVSYVLENREVMKRIFPRLIKKLNIRPVYDYPVRLREMLEYITGEDNPRLGIWTPGVFNSAYYEHSLLAQRMGVDLVEGGDLVVENHRVYMKTTHGLKRVHGLYRRVNDDFMDPLAFNPESLLGVPGIFEAYRRGNIALVNAPGTGVADDKVVYAFVPDMIRYYLDEDPVLPGVETYLCSREKDRKHVLANLANLVVKPANGAGGYDMLIGPRASKGELEEFARKVEARPRDYIAQPVISLSRVPTVIDKQIEGRHVDFRPFMIYGKKPHVMPGGLTRVALKKGSLVVNSSQGGGSKDTWVLA